MKTHLQITYPQHPGQAFPIAASNGLTLPTRARSDVRKGKGYPIRILTRAEWDDQNKPAGPYLAAYQPMRPVPDVDFEAEDGSLWPTAEACLEHELKRFRVKSLAELWEQVKGIIQDQNALASLYDEDGNPPFSGVALAEQIGKITPKTFTPEEEAAWREALAQAPTSVTWNQTSGENLVVPSPDEAARLLASAVSQRGLKIADAAKATGLSPAQVKATAASLPGQFEQKGGRVFLVG